MIYVNKIQPFNFAIFYVLIHCGFAGDANGCTPLDSWSFGKITSKFKYSLIKFDTAYPYGSKHEDFGKICVRLRSNNDIIVAEVGVKDYGDMDNKDFAESFGVKVEDFPVVKLLVGKQDPITFDGEFTYKGLKKFIRSHTDLYVGCENCLEEFDKLVFKLISSKSDKEKESVLKDAEKQKDKTADENGEVADIYLKLMKKIVEKGDSFIEEEASRIEKLLDTKMAKDKVKQLRKRSDIVTSFKHEEL